MKPPVYPERILTVVIRNVRPSDCRKAAEVLDAQEVAPR